MNRLLNIKELSQKLSIKTGTLYAWVNEGHIPYIKINGLVRFDEKEIGEWLSKKKQKGRTNRIPDINLD